MLHDGTHLGTTAMYATNTLHLQQAQLTAPFYLLSAILSHLSNNNEQVARLPMWLPCFGFLPLCVFHLYRQRVIGSCSASDSSYTRSLSFPKAGGKAAAMMIASLLFCICSDVLLTCAMKALHSAQVCTVRAGLWGYSWSRCRGSHSRSLQVHHCLYACFGVPYSSFIVAGVLVAGADLVCRICWQGLHRSLQGLRHVGE